MRVIVALVVALLLSLSASAQDPCWPTDAGIHSWEFPRHYRNVETGSVIEVLSEVCLNYDDVYRDDGVFQGRVCWDRRVSARNVVGPGLAPTSPPRRLVVYQRGEDFFFANVFIPYYADAVAGIPAITAPWALLPRGCYPLSPTVISNSYGYVIVTHP